MKDQIILPSFVSFFVSPAGQWTRIIAGAAIIGIGMAQQTPKGKKIAAFGLLPLLAGALDFCTLAPLLGGYFSGDKTRAALNRQQGHPELGSRSVNWARG
ncbi:MAG: YgaP-like transmembrane domain [Pseudobdellovibrionaceae bacterium]